eukprot:2493946-Amphidinium_carterae.1
MCKVSTVNNLADIFTKYAPATILHHLLPLCGVKPAGSATSYSVNSVHSATSSRLPTTPRSTTPRRTRTSRGSTDRLEGGNNSNNNSNLPSAWQRTRSTSASRIVPST